MLTVEVTRLSAYRSSLRVAWTRFRRRVYACSSPAGPQREVAADQVDEVPPRGVVVEKPAHTQQLERHGRRRPCPSARRQAAAPPTRCRRSWRSFPVLGEVQLGLGVDVDAVGVLTTIDQPQQQTVSYSKRLFASTSTPSLQLNFTEDWKRSYVLLLFLIYLLILPISVRPIISTSTGQIFAKFSGLIELSL